MKFFLLGPSNGDTNPRDQRGETPLHWAAWNGHFHVCKLILDNTGDKNPEDNIGWTPLHAAAEKGHLAICHMIIKNIETNESKKLSNKVLDKNKYLLWLWEAGFEEAPLAPQGGSKLLKGSKFLDKIIQKKDTVQRDGRRPLSSGGRPTIVGGILVMI